MILKIVLCSTVFINSSANSVVNRMTLGNNACKNFANYFDAKFNENCFYNPDMFLETPDLITKYAGKHEAYKITTEDGYILTMFRIPRENPKGAILLQHPVTVNSRIYMSQGNNSLGLILWKAGYDVWLNNQRGTLFSEDHTNSSISYLDYWDFSFHEVGVFDIPSQIDLIKRVTKSSNIIFIGHSQGSTSGLIYAAVKNQHAKNSVKLFIFMAMPCYFQHGSSPEFLVANLIRSLPFAQDLLRMFKLGSVLPFLPVLVPLTRILFRLFPFLLTAANYIFSFFSGWTPEEIDPARVNFDCAIYFKNYSWKILIHYLQLTKTETKFQMFDYGRRNNLKMYHSEVPPLYPVENVTVPVYLVSSVNDILATTKDADLLFDRLPYNAKVYGKLQLTGFNHVDYFMGKHANTIYKKLLNLIDMIA
jgi:lysosomal acid lipase/cholesteryl ester hydrolase